MWRILVMGVIWQGLGCEFDRPQQLVHEHNALHRFLGHADVWDDYRNSYQRLVDNVTLLRPELLVEINHPIVESGHAVLSVNSCLSNQVTGQRGSLRSCS